MLMNEVEILKKSNQLDTFVYKKYFSYQVNTNYPRPRKGDAFLTVAIYRQMGTRPSSFRFTKPVNPRKIVI